ncbi:E3 ubiquitin-protein ligase TTC3-like isoform X3 [Thunnus albacares]|uniref:E3 ubiquitin-protein ligase TTC3-like isoform X3 n=1 Tax=Thunnus albacares TaxID=8236 RepID=UPI001CF60B3C|nr:E3 ubiquitin-protein ligase TTC3-like isoform X3 [Thunnus albacares]XP_044226032.1 E3 ubiquitin-protein ligase TTC3-like isoform X3 [Thunnus albacares]
MADSDSDSDYSYCEQMKHILKGAHKDTVITIKPSGEDYDRWTSIPVDVKNEGAQLLKLCAFWLPILLRHNDISTTTCWAAEIGLIDLKNRENLTMKHIHRIETLEAILRALEEGSLRKDQTKHFILISNKFNLHRTEALNDALCWLERTGDISIRSRIWELGHQTTCFSALRLIFTEFAHYIQEMGTNMERTMMTLRAQTNDGYIAKSEDMKKKGNESFQKNQYEEAVKFYSKAIEHYPDNHKLYGNRALCYIRSKKYLKAVGDGKRATLIKPAWAKGHYRYCEALFSLGHYKMAIEANRSAQDLCKDDQEGIKDLEQQHQKFITERPESYAEQIKTDKEKTKRPVSTNRADATELRLQPGKTVKINSVGGGAPQRIRCGLVTNIPTQQVKKERTPQAVGSAKGSAKSSTLGSTLGSIKDSKPSKSESFSKNGKGDSNPATKKKSKSRNGPSEDEKVADTKSDVCRELRSMVQDAHTALTDLRSRNAEQAFSRALALVDTSTPKELGLSPSDVPLLLFGRASALTEIGQSEELAEAQKLLEKIKSFEERKFQCLVYYAVGKVYVKENRFAVALEQFSDSLQMVKNQITPGKLTWPLTKEIVKETQQDYFKEILESAIELCKFPPIPDAICRHEKCHGHLKTEIYFTDPDFKGFIQIRCCQSCVIEYHITCWKMLKTSSFFEKNEKEFLQEACLTPDCVGQICSIRIFCPTGLVKCKFEVAITKPQTPKKPRVNQKCTSVKKLKSKEERRLKRKQYKKSFQDNLTCNDELLMQKDDSATHSQQKVSSAWSLYRDRVLLQISQNMELLREEKGLHMSTLTSSLKPWLELDLSRGNEIAGRILNWQQENLETLGQAVELLLERKNRVWARVLIHLLSGCLDTNPKLNNWACRLNDAGLNAAKFFIERNAEHLEQLDLALLLNFGPLQEMIIEKLGTRPELFSSIGLTVTEYLKQAPPHDMRLFIWTLEEHRGDYDSCHTILDEYFDMIDGHCSVLKKSDENQNNSPMKTKSRGRKKKQKEPKGVIVLSGMRGVTPRDEWDQDFFEDDSLSFLHPVDPFSVPSHLREQVTDFEEQYNSMRHGNHFLDNNPDPTKESLYDYFAQILEEHGPLVAEDPLLVGEVENFPRVAQLKIQEAGGFECFLLESLRFIKMGRSIGLAKHAVSLQQAEHGSSLDDLDDLEDPDTNSSPPDLHACYNQEYLFHIYSSAETDVYPVLPNPYAFGTQPLPLVQSAIGGSLTGFDPFSHWSNGDDLDSQQHAAYFLPNGYEDLDSHDSEVDVGVRQTNSSSGGIASVTSEESVLKKHEAVQTCLETMRSVAVNTEPHEHFESCHGDIHKKEKSIKELEKNISKMENGCDEVNLKRKEEIAFFEEEIKEITVEIQVTNKDLVLLQQKLEEEVKKDQMEKKANQEVLKSLKLEIEKLVEEHGSLTQNIREKKKSCDGKLSDFSELRNQSAAEKMSLEDEIKRCKALFTTASRRSHTAKLSVAKSSRDQGLYSLYRELEDAKALLTQLDEAAHKYPSQDLEITRKSCRANVQEVEKKISTAEMHYQEQMDQVKNGVELFPVNNTKQPEPSVKPLSVAAKDFSPQSSAAASHRTSPLIQQSAPAAAAAEAPAAPAKMQHKPPTKTLQHPHSTVFEKAMERLAIMFPDYTRSNLMRFVQELRSSSGGSLSSMTLQDVVGGVTQLILDHQEKLSTAKASAMGRRSPANRATPPLVTSAPVWQQLGPQRPTHSNALNMEDPCIICHEDMSPDDICVLECRHSFHKECIKSWLKEQSTCPTCRDHALLPDDFPVLPGRRRQAP